MMNRIYRWKSSQPEGSEQSAETKEVSAVEESPGGIGDKAQQIRALIPRMADLSHYRALEDIDFIIEAIGEKNYKGSPALDVLPSHEDINRERRDRVKEYIYCLTAWSDGKDLEDTVGEFKANEKVVRNIYTHLGELDEEKKWLVQALIKDLAGRVSSPEDVLSEISDSEFINHVYRAVLGRVPEEDDLKLRLMELKRGRSRQDLIKDILESRESRKRMVSEIAESIRQLRES